MIKKAEKTDLLVVAELMDQLWPGSAPERQAIYFIKYEEDRPVGFAQCQLRTDYVEGCRFSPVGYLEGIFVREECRRKGYAKALLAACMEWAKTRGCREFASDCELNNAESLQFHLAAGFAEVSRNIHFKREL